jgi:energy-coupling factor transporter ATP-binding protein EcfA2
MYATRIRPGGRWLSLVQPGGAYAGWVVVVGPNGAGKSDLLDAVAAAKKDTVDGEPRVLAHYRDDRKLSRNRLAALGDDIAKRAAGERGVVLIDEVEAHLHISVQQQIGFLLVERFPTVQFLVTTHSPYICQAADVLVRLDPQRGAYVADDALFDRVVYGSGDDAALSDLFALESPYSMPATALREELVTLEMAVLDGTAGSAQVERFHDIQALLTSSPTARTEEVKARLRRRAASRERRV